MISLDLTAGFLAALLTGPVTGSFVHPLSLDGLAVADVGFVVSTAAVETSGGISAPMSVGFHLSSSPKFRVVPNLLEVGFDIFQPSGESSPRDYYLSLGRRFG